MSYNPTTVTITIYFAILEWCRHLLPVWEFSHLGDGCNTTLLPAALHKAESWTVLRTRYSTHRSRYLVFPGRDIYDIYCCMVYLQYG